MRTTILGLALFLSACTAVHARSVQLRPPTVPTPGLICGDGVQKIAGSSEQARRSAYLKAIDDLLAQGSPVLVSRTIREQTTVINAKSASRLESTFWLRASTMFHPTVESVIESDFIHVRACSTSEDIDRGWREFVEWRARKIEQARNLFQKAKDPERLSLLEGALALLKEAGAGDDSLYYEVKSAIDRENAGTAERNAEHRREVARRIIKNLVIVGAVSAASYVGYEYYQKYKQRQKSGIPINVGGAAPPAVMPLPTPTPGSVPPGILPPPFGGSH